MHLIGSFFFILFHAVQNFAGNEKGNGGYAVLCAQPPENYKNAELLDFTEGRILRDLIYNIGSENMTYIEKVNWLINRLANISPNRAEMYRDWFSRFNEESKFLKNIELGDIGDSDHIATPVGCNIKPTINQKTPRIPGEKRYIINQDIWEQLDESNKAGLILHELIYRELPQPSSIKVRYYNSIIASTIIEQFTIQQLIQLHIDSDILSLDIQNINVDLSFPIVFFENQKLKKATPVPGSSIVFRNEKLTFNPYVSMNKERWPNVELYDNGQIKSFVPKERVQFVEAGMQFQINAFDEIPLQLWPDGHFREGTTDLDSSLLFDNPFCKLEIGLNGINHNLVSPHIRFDEHGNLTYASTGSGQIHIGSSWYDFHNGYKDYGIEFYPNGSVKSGFFPKESLINQNGLILRIKEQSSFFENGNIEYAKLSRPLALNIQNKKIRFRDDKEIEFYENAMLRCAYLEKEELLIPKDSPTPRKFSYQVCFTQNGLVDPEMRINSKFE
jgi:hypothetical protein